MNPTSFPKSAAGKYFFVSGISGGTEVFVGKAIDEPFEERLALEGRSLHVAPGGALVVRPFNTIMTFFLLDPNFAVQHVAEPDVHQEIHQLLASQASHVSRASYPFLYRWVETAIGSSFDVSFAHPGYPNVPHFHGPQASFHPSGWSGPFHAQPFPAAAPFASGFENPFEGFHRGFVATAEHFRRALYQSPQVTSTSELDKVTELEGDLTIEMGKLTNQIASKFNQIVARESALSQHFAAFDGATSPLHHTGHPMAGWSFLMNRVHFGKNWARRHGKAGLVRELHALIKESVTGMNQVILEHCAVLDTLISDAFAHYGISFEVFGDVSSLTHFTGHGTGHAHEASGHRHAGSGV